MAAHQIAYPVHAVAWATHAATTIKDASGAVIAECSGHGRYSHEDAAIAAQIVAAMNAHADLIALARRAEHLNPAAEEIGAGTLVQLVALARAGLENARTPAADGEASRG